MLTRIRERNERDNIIVRMSNRKGQTRTRQELSSWSFFSALVDRGSDGKYMTTKGSLGFFREGRQQQVATQ